jgi:hypothetical protein
VESWVETHRDEIIDVIARGNYGDRSRRDDHV